MSSNGFTNYETWEICLELDNDQSTQKTAIEIVKHNTNDYVAGQALKDWINEIIYEQNLPSFIVQTAINVFLQKADWTEIANHFREEE